MTKVKILKSDVPKNRPCHIYTENNLGLISKMKDLKPKYSGQHLLKFQLDWDLNKLLTSIWQATEKYKWWGWVNKNADTHLSEKNKIRLPYEGVDLLNRGSYYGGWSIKSNPVYCSTYGISPEAAGMGELPSPISWFLFSSLGNSIYKKLEESNQLLVLTRIAVENGYKAMLEHLSTLQLVSNDELTKILIPAESLEKSIHNEKDSYFDTWSYTSFTPAAQESKIKNLLANTQCQVIRSRVAWQRGAFRHYRIKPDINDNYTWHSDEPIVHNLRINIAVKTSSAFGLEIKGSKPVILESGYAYTWDSNIVHRQIQVDNSSREDRINMIVGFNPWFNWDDKQQAWVSNEFYGKIHPLDMAMEGLVIPGMKFVKEEIS